MAKRERIHGKTGVYLVYYFGENAFNNVYRNRVTLNQQQLLQSHLLQLYYVNSKHSFRSQRILALEVHKQSIKYGITDLSKCKKVGNFRSGFLCVAVQR